METKNQQKHKKAHREQTPAEKKKKQLGSGKTKANE